MKYDWKNGEEIICINNIGMMYNLTIGKTYIVDYTYFDEHVKHVHIYGDHEEMECFCSRFTTLKQQRKEKLQKIKQSI